MKIYTILLNEDIDSNFNRYDLAVNYITIDNLLKQKDCSLYKKMHEKRIIGFDSEEGISQLLKYIEVFRNNEDYEAIELYRNYTIANGAHRLACAIYFEHKDVFVDVKPGLVKRYYGIDWFKEKGFTEEELKQIEETKWEILKKL